MARQFVTAAPGFAMADPSIQSDQTALERQMRLAEMLRGQSLQGFGPTESFGGYAVKRSPLEGVAKVVQALMASKIDKETDEGRGRLAAKQGAAMQQMMQGLLGGPPSSPPSSPQLAGPGISLGGVSVAPEEEPQPQEEPPQVAQLKRAAMSAMLMGNQELANKLIGNLLEMTGEQKDMAAMGIDPKLMGRLRVAAARKGGMMEMQPGTTTIDLATGTERFQPKLGEGMRPTQGGGAELVPGVAQALGTLRGAEAEAAEGAKLIDVPLGDGRTVKMTQAQYLQMTAPKPPPSVAQAAAANGDTNYAFNVGGRAGTVTGAPGAGQIGVTPNPVAQAAATAAATGEAGGVGKFHADNYTSIQKAGMEASSVISRLDRLNELLQGVDTGKLTPAGTEVAAFAESLGLKIDPKLGNKQAADALIKEMTLQMRNPSGGAGMPGAMSDADRQFLSKMTPSLATSPEGRALMIETSRKMAQRDQQVADLALDYRMRTGRMDDGFFKELRQWSAKNPLFTPPAPTRTAAPPRAGATPTPAKGGALTPQEQAELDALRKRFGRQ